MRVNMTIDPRILKLYDEYTHAPLPRREFLERLTGLCGSTVAAMALLPLLDSNYANAATIAADDARIATSWVTYKGTKGEVRAYLATPKAGPARRPGVVVVHENRGLTPHIQDVTRRIALAGFTGLGVDLLSSLGGTPADEDQGRELFAKIDRNSVYLDAVAAIAYLESRSDAAGTVGAVGFCFGGQIVNQMAVASPELDAAVAFYGRQPPNADVPRIKARVQLHYAANDDGINAGMAAYEAALKANGVRYEQHVYPGVEHAFHNDSSAARYNKAAADLAWSRTIAFLRSALVPSA
jgi:carboxymethylenebutenolidase